MATVQRREDWQPTDMQAVRDLFPAPPPSDYAHMVDQEAEGAVLAMILLGGEKVAEQVLLLGLRPHHFWTLRYEKVFEAIQALVERDQAVDKITLRAALQKLLGDRQAAQLEMDLLTMLSPMISNTPAYVQRVLETHAMRQTQRALNEAQEALSKGDQEAMRRAVEKLGTVGQERRRDSLTPGEWGEMLTGYLQQEKQAGFIPLPFPSLTTAMGGGMLPGELMLISGYTNHGKSVIADQMLDEAAKRGMRGHLYMTEMTAAQRGLRLISRRTGIPFGRLRSRALSSDDWKLVLAEIEALPYGVSIVSDWDIEDVVRDALRSRYDLVVIDLIHGFRYDDERGLDRLSKAAQRLARVSTTKEGWGGCAVVIVAHLSGSQMANTKSVKRPQPGLQSLKGSTSLSQDPDFVLFVWQKDDDNGLPTGEGKVYIPKARSGENEVVNVILNPRYLRFEVAADA